jgi:hypothetical protein
MDNANIQGKNPVLEIKSIKGIKYISLNRVVYVKSEIF